MYAGVARVAAAERMTWPGRVKLLDTPPLFISQPEIVVAVAREWFWISSKPTRWMPVCPFVTRLISMLPLRAKQLRKRVRERGFLIEQTELIPNRI